MNEPRPLLTLYKLLWEQIKGKRKQISLMEETLIMNINDKISFSDESFIDEHIRKNFDNSDVKVFVQRMIKELENDK